MTYRSYPTTLNKKGSQHAKSTADKKPHRHNHRNLRITERANHGLPPHLRNRNRKNSREPTRRQTRKPNPRRFNLTGVRQAAQARLVDPSSLRLEHLKAGAVIAPRAAAGRTERAASRNRPALRQNLTPLIRCHGREG